MLLFKKIEGYRIVKRLGAGRYGICYLAHPLACCSSSVVLKYFRPRMFEKNRFNNHHEAVILSNLCHPAIPEFLGVINHPRGYFFILEWKSGVSLQNLLFRQHIKFEKWEIHQIGEQLLELMGYLHQAGVVHRDISIANVLSDGKKIALVDFGLARYASQSESFQLDYACFGNLLLFLLYSNYHGKKSGAWYEELNLSEIECLFLKRLLRLDTPFSNVAEIREKFKHCFL